MTNLQELLRQQESINKQISAIRATERARAISDVRNLMELHGLKAAEVAGHSASKGTGRKVAIKYRDPVTGATWTGRGLKSRWMAEAFAGGKTLSDFAI